MALNSSIMWEIRSGSTANNVNGGGFDFGNTDTAFLTDLACDTDTGDTDSPVVTSGFYSFVAGDVDAWLYVSAGTDWTPGFYRIDSVDTGAGSATLDASVGAALQYNATTQRWQANTVAGCGTVATPTSGTWSVDYSQQNAAVLTKTDLTCTAGSTTISSATATFTRAMVGNILHATALTGTGALVGWYRITGYVSGTSVTLDRTPTNGVNNITAGTYYVGGAMSMNSTLDDEFMDAGEEGNTYWVKGAITAGETISINVNTGTAINMILLLGYQTMRGDNPTSVANMPTWNCQSNPLTLGTRWISQFISFTGVGTSTLIGGSVGRLSNLKVVNTSTTVDRAAISPATALLRGCEIIAYRGRAVSVGSSRALVVYCYIHDSDIGFFGSASDTSSYVTRGNIFCSNVTYAYRISAAITGKLEIIGNTMVGASTNSSKLGIGVSFATGGSADIIFEKNIIAGFVGGASHADNNTQVWAENNNWYNNTTDINSPAFRKGESDLALDPGFTSLDFLSGSTATTSGNVLTQSGADFTASGVVAGRDYIYISSGTGITVSKYGITAVGTTTLTLDIAPGTNATADKVWQITIGRNFAIGTNLKAQGYPGVFTGGLTTGYTDIGAVQRQEQGGASSFTFG